MVWAIIGVAVLLAALWVWERHGARDRVDRVRLQPDPFVDRRSMVRYHAALRPKGRQQV